MRLRRRDRDQPKSESKARPEERFFEETVPEAHLPQVEVAEPSAQPEGPPREPELEAAGPEPELSDDGSVDETEPTIGRRPPALVVESDLTDSPIDLVLELPEPEPPLGEPATDFDPATDLEAVEP